MMAVKFGGEHSRVFRSISVVFVVDVVRYESLGLHEAGLYEEIFWWWTVRVSALSF